MRTWECNTPFVVGYIYPNRTLDTAQEIQEIQAVEESVQAIPGHLVRKLGHDLQPNTYME